MSAQSSHESAADRLPGIDQLQARLEDIASPGSLNFGDHMTHEDIAAITATDASARVVSEHLESKGAQILRSTGHGEYITAAWTVGDWEQLLSAEFHEFEGAEKPLYRSFEYSLPQELETHVHSVLNVLEVHSLSVHCIIRVLTAR